MDMTDPETHFRTFFQSPPQRILERSGITVWLFDTDEDRVLVTTGMYRHAQIVPVDQQCVSREPRTELMMFCAETDAERLAEMLVDVALYPQTEQCFLHWWHILPLGQPIIESSKLMSLLFTFPPFDESFATFEVSGHRIDVLWTVPITEREHAYFKTQGVDALEERFEREGVEVTDLLRKSVVYSSSPSMDTADV